LFWVKNANFFANFFAENVLKITTSVTLLTVLSHLCEQKKIADEKRMIFIDSPLFSCPSECDWKKVFVLSKLFPKKKKRKGLSFFFVYFFFYGYPTGSACGKVTPQYTVGPSPRSHQGGGQCYNH
jgi:hypothetical protein